MSRLLAAALAAVAVGGAAAAPSGSPTLVLSSSAALGGAAGAGDAPGGVSYESLSQAELAAGLLRASGAAPEQAAGWEARHWPAGEDAPQLLAVLVGSVDAARQVRVLRRMRASACAPHPSRPETSHRGAPAFWQELRDALAASPASLALANAAPAEPRGLAAELGAALDAARRAGGKVGSLLLSDACAQVRTPRRAAAPTRAAARRSWRACARRARSCSACAAGCVGTCAQRLRPQP